MEYTQEKLDSHIKTLPTISQRAISSIPIGKIIQDLGGRHGYLIDEINDLYLITMAVLTGLEDPVVFGDKLEDALGLKDAAVQDLVRELNALIFKPVYDKTVELSQQGSQEEEIPTSKRDSLLSEIESINTPQPPTDTGKNLVKQKLENLFHVTPGKSDQSITPTEKKAPEPVTPKNYGDQDPYHEPIE